MTDRVIPKGFEACAAFMDEMTAKPDVVYSSIREACEDLGPHLTPRALRQEIYDGRVTAKKKPDSHVWTEVSVPYLWSAPEAQER